MSIASPVIRLIALVAILSAIGSQARAAAPDPASAATDTTASPAEPVSSASFRLWYQFGLGLRLNDRQFYSYDSELMATFEITGMRWDGHSTTWGLGVRLAEDDLSFRLGPKALVRRPLGSGGKAYYQFAATYYLYANASVIADRPGWALEAEIAPVKALAFVLGLELIQLDVYDYSSGDDPAWFTESINNTYLSVKFSQWWGVGVTVVLFALAGLAVSGGTTVW